MVEFSSYFTPAQFKVLRIKNLYFLLADSKFCGLIIRLLNDEIRNRPTNNLPLSYKELK
jgi:hypothetical protein